MKCKKILCFALALILLTTLSSCKKGSGDSDPGSSPESSDGGAEASSLTEALSDPLGTTEQNGPQQSSTAGGSSVKPTKSGTTSSSTGGSSNAGLDSLRPIGAWQSSFAMLETDNPYKLYYKPSNGYVGDAMPMFDNGVFHMFYLHDARDGKPYYHPFARATTTDFSSFTDKGIAVNYSTSFDQKDPALGTGCVIRKGNTYYAFYTGNNSQTKREYIMLATSSDGMGSFTKQSDFLISPPAGYSQDLFRDPQVYLDTRTNTYWMLIFSKKNGAVILKYTSADLLNWSLEGELFRPSSDAAECPDLFKMGEYYYLIYSTWPNCTRYAYSTSLDGPWTEPGDNALDGNDLYAAKTVSDGKNRYASGWVWTKKGCSNNGSKEWAGNLVTHKLTAQPDGTLTESAPDAVLAAISKKISLDPSSFIGEGSSQYDNGVCTLKGDYTTVLTGNMYRTMRISCKLTFSSNSGGFGFVFGSDEKLKNGMSFGFNAGGNKAFVAQDKYSAGSNTYRFVNLKPDTPVQVDIVIDGSIAVLYVDNKVALSARMYGIEQGYWGFYSTSGEVKFNDINVFKG